VPPPQVAEQVDQADQVPAQSTGTHAAVLQAWMAGEAGHGFPPLAAGVATLKVCDCEPPPHGNEQEPKPLH